MISLGIVWLGIGRNGRFLSPPPSLGLDTGNHDSAHVSWRCLCATLPYPSTQGCELYTPDPLPVRAVVSLAGIPSLATAVRELPNVSPSALGLMGGAEEDHKERYAQGIMCVCARSES